MLHHEVQEIKGRDMNYIIEDLATLQNMPHKATKRNQDEQPGAKEEDVILCVEWDHVPNILLAYSMVNIRFPFRV